MFILLCPLILLSIKYKGAVMVVIQLLVQSVPITTKVLSSNPFRHKVYLIQHYVIEYISDLRQVGGFLWVLQFPPPIKLTALI